MQGERPEALISFCGKFLNRRQVHNGFSQTLIRWVVMKHSLPQIAPLSCTNPHVPHLLYLLLSHHYATEYNNIHVFFVSSSN
jgi:hypothetical protein